MLGTIGGNFTDDFSSTQENKYHLSWSTGLMDTEDTIGPALQFSELVWVIFEGDKRPYRPNLD